MFILSFLLLNLITSDPKDTRMNCPDVTLRCITSHLYHAVSCNVFTFVCTASTVYLHCVHVRLLCVMLNISQSIILYTHQAYFCRPTACGDSKIRLSLYIMRPINTSAVRHLIKDRHPLTTPTFDQ